MKTIVRQIHITQDFHEVRSGMHIEFRHLRTIKAIHENGGLAKAADQLHITQSALSHQIKGLEDQAGVELFVRRSKPMKLSAAGFRLLRLAEKILPEIDAMQAEFSGLRDGKSGRLHIAIECHACFEWLFPVLLFYCRRVVSAIVCYVEMPGHLHQTALQNSFVPGTSVSWMLSFHF